MKAFVVSRLQLLLQHQHRPHKEPVKNKKCTFGNSNNNNNKAIHDSQEVKEWAFLFWWMRYFVSDLKFNCKSFLFLLATQPNQCLHFNRIDFIVLWSFSTYDGILLFNHHNLRKVFHQIYQKWIFKNNNHQLNQFMFHPLIIILQKYSHIWQKEDNDQYFNGKIHKVNSRVIMWIQEMVKLASLAANSPNCKG